MLCLLTKGLLFLAAAFLVTANWEGWKEGFKLLICAWIDYRF
jgi:hypothetical protein